MRRYAGLDTPESWDALVDNWTEILHAAGVREADRIYFAFSFGPFIGFWLAFEAASRLGCLCLPGGGLSSAARLRAILDNGATVLCCTPTYALRLAEAAAEDKIDLRSSQVRLLIVAGRTGREHPSRSCSPGGIVDGRANIRPSWNERSRARYLRVSGSPRRATRDRISLSGRDSGSHKRRPCSAGPDWRTGINHLDPLSLARLALSHRRSSKSGSSRLALLVWPLRAGARGRHIGAQRRYGGCPGSERISQRRRANRARLGRSSRISRGDQPAPSFARAKPTDRASHRLPGRGGPSAQTGNAFETALSLRVPINLVPFGTLPRFEMKAKRWIKTGAKGD